MKITKMINGFMPILFATTTMLLPTACHAADTNEVVWTDVNTELNDVDPRLRLGRYVQNVSSNYVAESVVPIVEEYMAPVVTTASNNTESIVREFARTNTVLSSGPYVQSDELGSGIENWLDDGGIDYFNDWFPVKLEDELDYMDEENPRYYRINQPFHFVGESFQAMASGSFSHITFTDDSDGIGLSLSNGTINVWGGLEIVKTNKTDAIWNLDKLSELHLPRNIYVRGWDREIDLMEVATHSEVNEAIKDKRDYGDISYTNDVWFMTYPNNHGDHAGQTVKFVKTGENIWTHNFPDEGYTETIKYEYASGQWLWNWSGVYSEAASNATEVVFDDDGTKYVAFRGKRFALNTEVDAVKEYVDSNAMNAVQWEDVDAALSNTSTNPVQNKVVKAALDLKAAAVDLRYRIAEAGYATTGARLPNNVMVMYNGSALSDSEYVIVKYANAMWGLRIVGKETGVATWNEDGSFDNSSSDVSFLQDGESVEPSLLVPRALADRTVNEITATDETSINVVFPDPQSGYSRDFYIRIELASGITNAPSISCPTNITLNLPDGKFPEIATSTDGTAVTILHFTETKANTFAVTSLLNGGEGESTENLIPKITHISHADLTSLCIAEKLIPGAQYRITNYVATTTQEYTMATNHVFDIIVTADSTNVLNETARAIRHDGDTYFPVATKFEAWELKYCVFNDNTRFEWADTTNGKGVVYRMKDEFNNDCPYDFKNILFQRWAITNVTSSVLSQDAIASLSASFVFTSNGGKFFAYQDSDIEIVDESSLQTILALYVDASNTKFYFTFDSGSTSDNSISGDSNEVYSNRIKEYVTNSRTTLNCIVFLGNDCYYNTFGNGCYFNTFGNDCYSNTFGNGCYFNTFGNYCNSNTFGNGCYFNTFGNDCTYNTFGNDCTYNTFGNDCYFNTFGNDCYSNTFGNGNDVIGNSYQYISFDAGVQGLTLYATNAIAQNSSYRYVEIKSGITDVSIVDTNMNQTVHTTYQPKNSIIVEVETGN